MYSMLDDKLQTVPLTSLKKYLYKGKYKIKVTIKTAVKNSKKKKKDCDYR